MVEHRIVSLRIPSDIWSKFYGKHRKNSLAIIREYIIKDLLENTS